MKRILTLGVLSALAVGTLTYVGPQAATREAAPAAQAAVPGGAYTARQGAREPYLPREPFGLFELHRPLRQVRRPAAVRSEEPDGGARHGHGRYGLLAGRESAGRFPR